MRVKKYAISLWVILFFSVHVKRTKIVGLNFCIYKKKNFLCAKLFFINK